MNHKVQNQTVNFIWSIADDVLRNVVKRGKYRDIILPFTVLRRLDVLLEPTKEKVLETYEFLQKQKINDKSTLNSVTKYPFFNHSKFTLTNLLNDPDNIESNLENYLDGYSDNVQEIISKFKLRNQLETLSEGNITYSLIEKFVSKDVNLSPNEALNTKGEKLPPLTNLGMGYVFEELIRKFNEENNEEAGEHFTPREIIKLMTNVVFLPLKNKLKDHARYRIYDPCCGSGGMLTESEGFALKLNNTLEFALYGQESEGETYAICTADMLIKNEDPENIYHGSTLSNDGFGGQSFEFMLSNPPYGKSWKNDYDSIIGEKKEILDRRFFCGVPRSSDGQLLFLMNMVSKMVHSTDLGSKIASVHNGSSLFTGDAGSGESEIRRHIIENDYLEAIIGLPKNMFYNTGINTYIWVLSNRKEKNREKKVQLIDASEIYSKMRKSLGSKSYELKPEHIEDITKLYLDFKETSQSKIFDNDDLGFNKITVERPLRLKVEFTQETIENLRFDNSLDEPMRIIFELYKNKVYDGLSKEKKIIEKIFEEQEIKIKPAEFKKLFDNKFWNEQKELMQIASKLFEIFGNKIFMDYNEFIKLFDKELKRLNISISATQKKKILSAVSQRDEEAKRVIKKIHKSSVEKEPELYGFFVEAKNFVEYESDSELRDYESIPLKQNIEEYFKSEVLPHVSDAWINKEKTIKGYEISFTKYFYKFKPLRDVKDIEADIKKAFEASKTLLDEIALS